MSIACLCWFRVESSDVPKLGYLKASLKVSCRLTCQQGFHVFLLQTIAQASSVQEHADYLQFFFCHAVIAILCAQVSSQVQDLSEQFALQVCFLLKVIVIP